MTIRVRNTMTGREEEFTPAQGNLVRIYVCGVTPYADSHVGHARPSVFWDVVRRYLEYRGFRVFLVQNFTDIDDKVIARANEMGADPLALSRAQSDEYLHLMSLLGVRPADAHPRVSAHIGDIIEVVRGLVEKGYAYERDGNVWFDVSKFAPYGKLSHRSQDELRAGARVEVDATKKNPSDFALWKRAKPGEPSWPSPWGPGRPGWHIECSAMALKYLGSDFDFHGGGSDLIFPHHENEIAQSEAYTGRPFCRNWLHNEMLNLRGEKMSKSLGNVVTLKEVLERAPGGAVRLLLLGAHYRKSLDFDFELLEENVRAWRRLNETVDRLREVARPAVGAPAAATPGSSGAGAPPPGGSATAGPSGAGAHQPDDPAAGEAPAAPLGDAATAAGSLAEAATAGSLAEVAATARCRFEEAMDQDFNTAGALAAIFDLAREVNARVAELGRAGSGRLGGPGAAELPGGREALAVMEDLGQAVLGVVEPAGRFASRAVASSEDVERLLSLIVDVRTRARAARDFALSDFIRDSLRDLGYEVRDDAGRTVIKRRD